MGAYTRQQAALLLLLIAAAGVGIAVGHWRRSYPELAQTLERLDRSPDVTEGEPGQPTARDGVPPGPSRFQRRGGAVAVSVASPSPSATPPGGPLSGAPPGPRRSRPAQQLGDGPLDLNRASVADLTRLPGIGPVLAARIVESRESDGAFDSVDDLRRVSGVGPGKLDRVRAMVTVSP